MQCLQSLRHHLCASFNICPFNSKTTIIACRLINKSPLALPLTWPSRSAHRSAAKSLPVSNSAAASRAHAKRVRQLLKQKRYGTVETFERNLRIHLSASAFALGSVLQSTPFTTPNPPISNVLRLHAHTYIHGLLRADKAVRASWNLHYLLRDEIRVRRRTVHALMLALISKLPMGMAVPEVKEKQTPPKRIQIPLETSKELAEYDLTWRQTSRVLTFSPSMVANVHTRHLLSLLGEAGTHRIQRPMQAYTEVIKSLISQQEFEIAALVIELLATDWQRLRMLDAMFSHRTAPPPTASTAVYYDLYQCLLASPVAPPAHLIDFIVSEIMSQLKLHLQGKEFTQGVLESIWQSSAILLGLLHRQQLPMDNVVSLIDLACVCQILPRHRVWVWRQTSQAKASLVPEQVELSSYANQVIEHLIEHLPSRPPILPSSLPDVPHEPVTSSEPPPAPQVATESSLNFSSTTFQAFPISNHPRHVAPNSVSPITPLGIPVYHSAPETRVELPPLPSLLPPLDEASYMALFRCAALHPHKEMLRQRLFRHMTRIRDPPILAKWDKVLDETEVPPQLEELASARGVQDSDQELLQWVLDQVVEPQGPDE